jgi:ubiquinone/menaquinone biosynthesis C-methylase UbiE
MPVRFDRSPRAAYNEGAADYDEWAWQKFWRLNEMPEIISEVPEYGAVLDVGCGTGMLLSRLSSPDQCCIGIDLSEGMLRRARARLGRRALLVQADARYIPFAAGTFDVVICSRVLSHIQDPLVVLGEFGRVLRTGAKAIVTDIDPDHNYEATKIPAVTGDLFVETYKHSPRRLLEVANDFGLEHVRSVDIRASSATWLPPAHQLHSIDRTSARGVGYMIVFRKG